MSSSSFPTHARSLADGTSGVFSDYFVTGVKTDKGLSVLLIERGEGVSTKAIRTSYSPAAGTTYITFDDVKVPVENLLGQENKGIHVILSNFNHERWTMACKSPPSFPPLILRGFLHESHRLAHLGATIRQCRTVVEESLKWANQRLVFGKRLIDQPVIRQK